MSDVSVRCCRRPSCGRWRSEDAERLGARWGESLMSGVDQHPHRGETSGRLVPPWFHRLAPAGSSCGAPRMPPGRRRAAVEPEQVRWWFRCEGATVLSQENQRGAAALGVSCLGLVRRAAMKRLKTCWYSSHETRIAIHLPQPLASTLARAAKDLSLARAGKQSKSRTHAMMVDALNIISAELGLVSHARQSRNHTLTPCSQMSSN